MLVNNNKHEFIRLFNNNIFMFLTHHLKVFKLLKKRFFKNEINI